MDATMSNIALLKMAGGIDTNKVRKRINSLSPYVPSANRTKVNNFSEVFLISIPPFFMWLV